MSANPRFRVPRLLQAALTVAFFYVAVVVVFDVALAHPIPASLLTMYMFFIAAGVFMVFTFTEDSARELVAPIRALVEDPEAFRELLAEGAEVYIVICQYCHGDKLDGKGPYAAGLNPVPLNFQDIGTIAQLQESFLFWRIATGGPGLPEEGAPWISSMPVWQDFLSEEEIWKVILVPLRPHRPPAAVMGAGMMAALPRTLVFTALLAAAPVADAALAQTGDADRGEEIHARRCLGCHGEEGDGAGRAAERLNPPPRDFSLGLYKFKTTAFDDDIPNDADLLRMIRDGMPGTAMPGWSDVLSKRDISDLIAYIKTFAGLEEEAPSEQVDYGAQVAASEDSIEKGRELFKDRRAECHGESAKGAGTKRLKDDNGARTWPRNLTKPWTFRASNDSKDIFSRVTVGIPGTQMPAFADPKSKKKLGIEERWHVANYVASLAKTEEVVRPENTVVKADKIDGDVPETPDDPRWAASAPVTFFLVPQILAKERLFTPSNDTITLRALYSDAALAILLEWDDRTRSLPGDPEAEAIADPGMFEDAVAVQLPGRGA